MSQNVDGPKDRTLPLTTGTLRSVGCSQFNVQQRRFGDVYRNHMDRKNIGMSHVLLSVVKRNTADLVSSFWPTHYRGLAFPVCAQASSPSRSRLHLRAVTRGTHSSCWRPSGQVRSWLFASQHVRLRVGLRWYAVVPPATGLACRTVLNVLLALKLLLCSSWWLDEPLAVLLCSYFCLRPRAWEEPG
jgi:hypothetical protein